MESPLSHALRSHYNQIVVLMAVRYGCVYRNDSYYNHDLRYIIRVEMKDLDIIIEIIGHIFSIKRTKNTALTMKLLRFDSVVMISWMVYTKWLDGYICSSNSKRISYLGIINQYNYAQRPNTSPI